MKKRLVVLYLFFSFWMYGQNTVSFSYDEAGNQIRREIVLKKINDVPPVSEEQPKLMEDLVAEDMQKLEPEPENTLTYYPNPVQGELYLKWENLPQKEVQSLEVFDLLSRKLVSFSGLELRTEQTIPFFGLLKGVYTVMVYYTNGERYSFKVIKE